MLEQNGLQHFVWREETQNERDDLYIKWDRQKGEIKQDKIILHDGDCLSTFTYFNGVYIDKWKEYTEIVLYCIHLQIEGHLKIEVWNAWNDPDGKTEKRMLYAEEVERSERGAWSYQFQASSLRGCIYLKIEAIQASVWYGGSLTGEVIPYTRDVHLAVGICTFRREPYVINNVQLMVDAVQCWDALQEDSFGIFVSDNGGTLSPSDFASKGVYLFRNKNVGGSGGFARCMLEAQRDKQSNWTHMIFMDDDIRLEPEVIYRTYQLFAHSSQRYAGAMLGGSLLRNDFPSIQHAKGECWDVNYVQFVKNGIDLRQEDQLLKNEEEVPIQYNGWWYCGIPFNQGKDNLPLPFFIHMDDIEFGLRHEDTIMTMNGIGVWHDSFENRKASSMEYYDMRNSLIMNAIHLPQYTAGQACKKVFRHLIHQLLKYRYEDQCLTIRGVEDFLRGIDFLKETDPVELHDEIRGEGYVFTDVSATLKQLGVEQTGLSKDRLYCQYKFDKKHRYSLNGWLLPAKRKLTTLQMGCHATELYRAGTVLYYDPDTGMGFETKRQRKMLFVTLVRYIRVAKLLKKQYAKVAEQYQERYHELTSQIFWKEYLQLEQTERRD